MEQLDATHLDEILEVLRTHGVTNFTCPAFSVCLAPSVVEPKVPDAELAAAFERKRQALIPTKGSYSHSSLWPNGKPPVFPGREEPKSPNKEI